MAPGRPLALHRQASHWPQVVKMKKEKGGESESADTQPQPLALPTAAAPTPAPAAPQVAAAAPAATVRPHIRCADATDSLRRTRRIVCLHTAALWAHLSLGGSDPIESASACTCGRSGRRSGSGEEYCDYRAVLRSTLRISPSKGCRSTPSARALHTALSHCTAACARPQLYDVGATARPMRVRARTHTSVRTQAQHVQACSAPAVRRRALSALVGRQPLSVRRSDSYLGSCLLRMTTPRRRGCASAWQSSPAWAAV